MKKLTLEDRKKIEEMWGNNATHIEIAMELGVCQATIYKELARGRETDEETGEVVLDKNFRHAYNAERAQIAYQQAISKRGRRPAATRTV